MPFDSTTAFLPEERKTRIDPVIAFFERGPHYWCKHRFSNGYQRCPKKVLEEMGLTDLEPLILRAAKMVTGKRHKTIPRFNDWGKTTYAELMMVLYKTREMLLSGNVEPVSFGSEVWNRLTRRRRLTIFGPLAPTLEVIKV